LKIRIEDAERQELSSYIAEVSKRVESEPDLDRRANILREACERYPSETQFGQQLKLIRERRDLVNSIVAKARQYEERGQYSEAISQWDILRKIHPQYPGIAFELEQCKKKRDRQAREEEQARLVEEIDGLMEGRAYAKAIERAKTALQEFPGDTELAGLLTLAEQGLERTKESRRLFEEGQRALAEKDLVKATDLLRSSLNLDPRGPGLRDAMVNVLAERARAMVEENWCDAEPIYQEASELDPNHPAVRALRSSISEAKRQTLVGQCLTEARALVAEGKSQAAAERVRAARAEYPNDPRLEQYEANLRKEVNEIRRREERGRDRAVLGEDRRVLEENPDRLKMRAVLERSQAIRAKHPDDPEIEQTVAEIELAIKRVANVEDLSQLLRMETVLTGTDGRHGVVSKPGAVPPRVEERKGPKLVDKSADKTKLFPTQDRKRKESTFQVVLREVEAFLHKAGAFSRDLERRTLAFARPAGQWSEIRLGAVGGAIVLIAVVGYLIVRSQSTQEKPPVNPVQRQYVHISPNPAGSTVTVDGKPITDGEVSAGATVEVAHPGYKTRRVQVQQEADGKVVLDPEPLHLSIQTSAKSGTVELDGKKIGDLSDGSMDESSLVPDGGSHKLSVVGTGRRLFTVEFQAAAGSRPQVTALDANDLFVVTSLGNSAKVYGGKLLKSVRFGDRDVAVSPSGTDFDLSEQNHEIKFGQGNDQGSVAIDLSNAPALAAYSVTAAGQFMITANAQKATLTVDGAPVQRQKRGWLITGLSGPHNFAITADGYEPQSWTMTLQPGQSGRRNVELVPKVNLPTLASLLITGGTPGAEVLVDGQRVAELDANGNLRLPNRLNAGKHTLAMAKLNYESRSVEISAKPPSDVSASNVALIPWAILNFQTAAKNATVRFRRVGESQFHDVNPSAKIPLAPGQYEIAAEAPGFQKFNIEQNLARENVTVLLKLVPIPDYEFLNPDQIVRDGAWIRSKNSREFVYLKPGFLHENLVFTRPGKTLFWDKKVEWVIEATEQRARLQYSLEGQKLTRKLVVAEVVSDQKEAKADAVSAVQATSRSLHVRVDGGHVTITNDRGVVLDDYTAQGRDFSSARIGIRTDSQFLVRSDNQ
jgi:tetratricopeptide (TPR) repeat protein